MHTQGHNPFMEFTTFDPYFGTGFQDYIQAQNPQNQQYTFEALQDMMGAIDEYQLSSPFGAYQYQGIDDSIQGALSNVFGGFQGHSLNEQLNAIQDLYAEDYASGNIVLTGGLEELVLGQDVIQGIGETDVESGEEAYYGTCLSGVNIFDPESLAATLTALGDNTIGQAEVKTLTPEMLEKTTSEYYSPYEEAERANLVDKLGTATAKVNTGGFAGSGSRTAGLSGAERLYRGGYEDILGDIAKLRGGATTDVLDTIYGWQELMG